jgi:hypothetical protein
LLTGRDGYLYGRGVSDNKGPLLASILATKALLDAGELDIDVCFIVEGEEESGLGLDQRGLEAVVQVCVCCVLYSRGQGGERATLSRPTWP